MDRWLGEATWNWCREVTRRTRTELDELKALLDGFQKQDLNSDSRFWRLSANVNFTTKKLTMLLDEKLVPSNGSRQVTQKNYLVPLKVEIFIWRVLERRIPVRTDLNKRGFDLDTARFPLCDDDVETIVHSMIFFRNSLDIWDRVYKWWKLGSFSNLSINEAFCGKSGTHYL
ncbi:uncharacterized protein [Rutidosis leptorrhynchoides]|uniref:uncharacterized protein n=1 Tax=Rutidosis leptorrhynchoides TaxID=125765 RepID=UPI003A993F09